MSDYLYFIHFAFNVKIHSFVLMSNHFHMIISTPEANLSAAMNYFMRETSKEINRLSGHTNQVFGGRYYRSLLTCSLYFEHAYKYVYRNPVSAGLAKCCEEYPYSTIHGLLGQGRLSVPIVEDHLLFDKEQLSKTLLWLNSAPTERNYIALKKALQKKTLKFPSGKAGSAGHSLKTNPF